MAIALNMTDFIATIRLAPLVPDQVAMAQFPDVDKAVSAVQEILNNPYGFHIRESTCRREKIFLALYQNVSSFLMTIVSQLIGI